MCTIQVKRSFMIKKLNTKRACDRLILFPSRLLLLKLSLYDRLSIKSFQMGSLMHRCFIRALAIRPEFLLAFLRM
uniref:Uncharacterized protein n=1 Tax=Anopheles aquasalis TaxID=42839 RepID=T1E960_ANOAQ